MLDGTLLPFCTMDCIRIFQKFKELKEEPESEPTLWSPIHYCKINAKAMTVILDSKPNQVLILVRGKTYERPRGKTSLRADASDCNLKAEWPKVIGAYGKLWAETYKGDRLAFPSMKEVVMGIYLHHMVKVELTFKDLKENHPERIQLYKNQMKKAFNHMLLCLDMGDQDIEEPLTEDILVDPNSP